MAGRGGGAGRGRATMSFSAEQLGFTPGEVLPGPVLQPPPLYPIMEFYPENLEVNDIFKEQIAFKNRLFNYLNGSSAFVPADEVQKGLANTNDLKQVAAANNKPLDYDWTRFPPELMPSVKKKRKLSKPDVPNKVAKKRTANVSNILDELEKKEVTEKDNENSTESKEKKKEDEEAEDEGDKEEYEDEDLDEEMDEGTDYNLNYFDNGEGYLDDDDDNLDDGPIY